MKHENENAANLHTGLKRREFMAMLAGCTAGLMVPSLFHGEGKIAAATASRLRPVGQAPAPAQAGFFRSGRDQPGRGRRPCGECLGKGRAGHHRKSLGGGGALLRQRPLLQRWKSRGTLWKIPHSQVQGRFLHHDQNLGHKQEECPEGPRHFPLPHEDRLRGPMAGACPRKPEGCGRARPKRCARRLSRGPEKGQGQEHRLHRP